MARKKGKKSRVTLIGELEYLAEGRTRGISHLFHRKHPFKADGPFTSIIVTGYITGLSPYVAAKSL